DDEKLRDFYSVMNGLFSKDDFTSYWFYLRNEYLPFKFGEDASSFMTTILNNGNLPPNYGEYMNENEVKECIYILETYSELVIRANLIVLNPYKLVNFNSSYNT